MAQYFTHFTILLLLAIANTIVCPTVVSDSGVPFIEQAQYNSQYPAHRDDTGASQSKKAQSHQVSPKYYTENVDEISKRIESIFNTTFGPGLILFPNTEPIGDPQHISPYTEYMHSDQPQTSSPSSSASSSSAPPSTSSSRKTADTGFFKVHRSPSGKLDLVYNKDIELSSHGVRSQGNSSSGNGQNHSRTEYENGNHKYKNTSAATPNTSNHAKKNSGPIHFPTETPAGANFNPTIHPDDCLEKEGEQYDKPFCTHLRNYPDRAHLGQIIKQKYSNLELFFGEDLVVPQNISQRMNYDAGEFAFCNSRERVVYPEGGLNREFTWHYIVNIPEYRQGIRIEECVLEGADCGQAKGITLPISYTAYCKQHYIYRNLVAYKNEAITRDYFKMPSCCQCVLRYDAGT